VLDRSLGSPVRQAVAAGCPRCRCDPGTGTTGRARSVGFPAVAHEAVHHVPRWADVAFAGQEAEQGTRRQTGAEGGERHDAGGGRSHPAHQVALLHQSLALVDGQVLRPDHLGGDPTTAPQARCGRGQDGHLGDECSEIAVSLASGLDADVDHRQEVGARQLVDDGAAAVAVGPAEHDVGIEQLPKDLLRSNVAPDATDWLAEPEGVEVAANDVHLGRRRRHAKVCGFRSDDPADVRHGVEDVVVDDRHRTGAHADELLGDRRAEPAHATTATSSCWSRSWTVPRASRWRSSSPGRSVARRRGTGVSGFRSRMIRPTEMIRSTGCS
jgi:hypothetical protein